jgi:hypothetical protein
MTNCGRKKAVQKAQKSQDKRRHFQRSFVRFAFALFVPLCGYGIFEKL